MSRLATSLIATLATLASFAATPSPAGIVWHDGWAFFACQNQGRELTFMGGTLHEGGYGFILTPQTGDKYTMRSVYEDANWTMISLSGRPNNGATATVKQVGDQTVMTVTDKGVLTDVLLGFDGDLHREQLDDMNKQLDGMYLAPDGTRVTFDGHGKCSIGSGATMPFTVAETLDMLTNIFSAGGSYYRWGTTDRGIKLELLEVKAPENWDDLDEIEDIKVVKTWYFTKEQGVRFKGDGYWPVTSQRVLTCGYFSSYDEAALRLMRTEIYARHGYIFKSDDLRNHFEAQSWYKPVTSDVSKISLSEIEQLNVSLIKRVEKIAADDR